MHLVDPYQFHRFYRFLIPESAKLRRLVPSLVISDMYYSSEGQDLNGGYELKGKGLNGSPWIILIVKHDPEHLSQLALCAVT